jgi:hypothetical protein
MLAPLLLALLADAGTIVTTIGTPLVLRPKDSVVWKFAALESVTHVDPSCNRLQSFDSQPREAPSSFYHTFNDPGVYYYASLVNGKCDKLTAIKVLEPPVNHRAVAKWEQFQKVSSGGFGLKPCFVLALIVTCML